MGWTADNQPSTFFAVCARLIGPEVKITLKQSLPGNLSVEDWQAMKEVLSAVREGLPSADQMPLSQVFERVLGDAMAGDPSHFAREDYVEEAWRIVDPVLKANTPVYPYDPNTWGPPQADECVVPPGGWHIPPPEFPSPDDFPPSGTPPASH